MKAVILAAGKGERLGPLTERTPKVMLTVANRPLLELNLEQLPGLIGEAIIVVGHLEEKIREHFGSSFKGIKIRYVRQARQLGTGHALRQAGPFLDGRFLLLMGDNLYCRKDIETCLGKRLSILVARVENPKIFGICTVKNGLLKDIVEKPRKPSSNLANAGLYVLDRRIFDSGEKKTERGEFEIVDGIRELARKEEVHAVEATDFNYITYPWHLLEANEKVLRKGGSMIEGSARIASSATVEGPVAIGKNADLKNCVIRPFTSIG